MCTDWRTDNTSENSDHYWPCRGSIIYFLNWYLRPTGSGSDHYFRTCFRTGRPAESGLRLLLIDSAGSDHYFYWCVPSIHPSQLFQYEAKLSSENNDLYSHCGFGRGDHWWYLSFPVFNVQEARTLLVTFWVGVICVQM